MESKGLELKTKAGAIAAVFFEGDEKNPRWITKDANDTDFTMGYCRTGEKGGYYEVTESKGWVNVHSDCILITSKDSKDLMEFDNKLVNYCKGNKIEFAIVICGSSNIYSNGYDFFVREPAAAQVREFIKSLIDAGHRDPVKFNAEATANGQAPGQK